MVVVLTVRRQHHAASASGCAPASGGTSTASKPPPWPRPICRPSGRPRLKGHRLPAAHPRRARRARVLSWERTPAESREAALRWAGWGIVWGGVRVHSAPSARGWESAPPPAGSLAPATLWLSGTRNSCSASVSLRAHHPCTCGSRAQARLGGRPTWVCTSTQHLVRGGMSVEPRDECEPAKRRGFRVPSSEVRVLGEFRVQSSETECRVRGPSSE